MYTGVVVEQSLKDRKILDELDIVNSWTEGSWVLYKVVVTEEQIEMLATYLVSGPWYIHFWDENKNDIRVVFKGTVFDIKASSKSTWSEAVTYGLGLGIPAEQLNFKIDQDA